MISAVSRAREYWLAIKTSAAISLAGRKPIPKPFGLLTAELGQPAAGSMATDHPGHRGLRFSMADEHETGHRAASLLFVCVGPLCPERLL